MVKSAGCGNGLAHWKMPVRRGSEEGRVDGLVGGLTTRTQVPLAEWIMARGGRRVGQFIDWESFLLFICFEL